jgi:hypothetical protein
MNSLANAQPEEEALRIKRFLEELNQHKAGVQRFYIKIWGS